ncbi:UNVERIFIED_CONTAM: hypothetical protein Sradi_7227300 [Sesamum radiatum]|uniref:Uncharacterized protein n=1 Tax=Sesamum radiatum TaxID=300843 RepID=A0AAW2INR0_SESRA
MHRIPSELRSQACLGESSTRMGDPLGSPRVAPLFANLTSRLSSHQLFLFFFFFACSPTRYRSLHEIPELPGQLGLLGPTERVWPTERDGRPKMGGTHPKWLNFGEMGHNGASPVAHVVELGESFAWICSSPRNSTRAQS